jgi:toxin ParE1/3/4
MAEIERKEVRISEQFDLDIISLYTYGEEVFGFIAAKSFIADIYSRVWSLDRMYLLHVECRHLPTKNKIYRNIILGSYLIIYRIKAGYVEVLRILHSHSSIRRIKSSRQIRPNPET